MGQTDLRLHEGDSGLPRGIYVPLLRDRTSVYNILATRSVIQQDCMHISWSFSIVPTSMTQESLELPACCTHSIAALAPTRATTMAPWIIALVPGVSCMYLSFAHNLARATFSAAFSVACGTKLSCGVSDVV